MTTGIPRLKLLPLTEYAGVNSDDPVRFYGWPVVGRMYRRRVELCLAECKGGKRVLDVGFGSGVTFLNLHERYGEVFGLDLTARVEEVRAVFQARRIETVLRNGSVLHMPYENDFFDTVILISILEHLRQDEQIRACREISRVLKPGGQMVYGVPVDRPIMTLMFRLLGFRIHEHHFSTEKDVARAARRILKEERIVSMRAPLPMVGAVYQVGHFVKEVWC